MTKPDTKKIKQQADAAKTYILHPQWRERVIALCNAYDEAQKRISTLEKALEALLEASDEVICHSVNAGLYPDGPCLDKDIRDDLKNAKTMGRKVLGKINPKPKTQKKMA